MRKMRKGRGMPIGVITYEPDNSLKKGYLSVLEEIICEIHQNKWLTWQLFKRDFLAYYKQSFIGIFWAIIMPLMSIGTFILMNKSGIFSIGYVTAPYPLFAVLGMALWNIFSTGVLAGSNSLIKAGHMISKINFSKKSLVIASFGQAIISFAIQIMLVSVLFGVYGILPNISILLLPVLIIPILLLTLGLGFILSLLNGIFRDIGNILSMLVTFLMFLTPILYSKPETGLLGGITKFNPLYYLIDGPRNLILFGTMPDPVGYIFAIIISFAVFIICIVAFHLTETRLAERV